MCGLTGSRGTLEGARYWNLESLVQVMLPILYQNNNNK